LRTKSDTGLKMHIFSRPDHQYACAQTDSRMMQAKAVQAANPSAHVVLLPNGNHFVFRSKEADVLREMNAFIATRQ